MINQCETFWFFRINFLILFGEAGITHDVRQDDQLEFHGRVDHHDDQNSTKQHIISCYKKNLYPALKAEIHRNSQHSSLSTSTTSSKGSK